MLIILGLVLFVIFKTIRWWWILRFFFLFSFILSTVKLICKVPTGELFYLPFFCFILVFALSCWSFCSNPSSSLLWSQLASYLLQACPDEQEVITTWLSGISCYHLTLESNSQLLWCWISTTRDWFKTLTPRFFNQSEVKAKTSSSVSRASATLFVTSFDGSVDCLCPLSFGFWFYDT